MWIKAGLDEGVAKLLEVKVEGPKKKDKKNTRISMKVKMPGSMKNFRFFFRPLVFLTTDSFSSL